jgi:hypothetical protein
MLSALGKKKKRAMDDEDSTRKNIYKDEKYFRGIHKRQPSPLIRRLAWRKSPQDDPIMILPVALLVNNLVIFILEVIGYHACHSGKRADKRFPVFSLTCR